jgi:hypothetical protein
MKSNVRNMVLVAAAAIAIIVILAFNTPKRKVPLNAILIGDSQTEDLANLTKDAYMVSDLQKVGWWVINLLKALKAYTPDPTVSDVFVCIGTNGVFSKADKVEELCDQLKITFPNANLYVIKGSYGWESDNKGISNIEDIMTAYYDRFAAKGVTVMPNAIGYSSKHPSDSTPSMIQIAADIDLITSNN